MAKESERSHPATELATARNPIIFAARQLIFFRTSRPFLVCDWYYLATIGVAHSLQRQAPIVLQFNQLPELFFTRSFYEIISGAIMRILSKAGGAIPSQTGSAIVPAQMKENGKREPVTDLGLNYDVSSSVNAITPDLICFSHLRWDFVYQRPQHLLSRFALDRRVFFVEEPLFTGTEPKLEFSRRDCGAYIVKPCLPAGSSDQEITMMLQALVIDDLILANNVQEYVLWYYTPMARAFTEHLEPLAIVYDCMDELSAFKNPPQGLKEREAELLRCADLVFTGGSSLYEAKRHLHSNIHLFPSSIEVNHFSQARFASQEPLDQQLIPRPRLGFFGVIDERFDIELLDNIARQRPDWQFVVVGPVVKIDPEELPRHPNIHYKGRKGYAELPAYLSGWDVAMIPFARNESTRFISPTKTPEYMAAGVPVISTSIQDVIRPYAEQGLVTIADTPQDFIDAAAFLMSDEFDRTGWLRKVDEALQNNSWDLTWALMHELINAVLISRYPRTLEDGLSRARTGTSSITSAAVSQAHGD